MGKMVFFKLLFVFYITYQSQVFAADLKRYIIDVDAGMDDYEALVFMLDADYNKKIKIEAITCSKGNTELKYVIRNVFRLLETAGRQDIPVYAGAYNPIIPHPEPIESWFGTDGFADLPNLKSPSLKTLQKTISPIGIYQILKNNPNKISIMILGPSTNVAISLIFYKDFATIIKDIIIMGGNYGEPKIEFNILGDPEGAHDVLELAKCPITLLTWQACVADPLTYGWRLSIKGINNPVWNLLQRAEVKRFGNESATDYWNSCDPITAFVALYPGGIKAQSKHYATVGLEGAERALILINDTNNTPNVNIIEKINVELYQKTFIETFKNICNNKRCKNIY